MIKIISGKIGSSHWNDDNDKNDLYSRGKILYPKLFKTINYCIKNNCCLGCYMPDDVMCNKKVYNHLYNESCRYKICGICKSAKSSQIYYCKKCNIHICEGCCFWYNEGGCGGNDMSVCCRICETQVKFHSS